MDDITLDEILSGDGEAVPAATEVQQPEAGQLRDEQGRFAANTAEPPAVEPEQPAQTETHADNGKAVPVGAVQAEREKRQAAQAAHAEAQAEAEALRREIAELRGMVTAQRQPAPQPQAEPQPVNLWEDPEGYLKSQMGPVQQQLQETRNMLMQFQATQQYGADKVTAALQAAKAIEGTPQEAALEAQIMGGGNPFGNLVQWHQQQQVMARIGNDPDAFLKAEQEKWLSDPAVQAMVIERARANAVQNGNRQQPVTNIPPSLSRIPSGGNQAADNDMSDGAIFSHAMR